MQSNHKKRELYLCDFEGNYVVLKFDALTAINKRFLSLVDAHIPGVVAYEQDDECKHLISTVEIVRAHHEKLIETPESITVHCEYDNELPLYILHLLYSVFHKHWLKIGVYSVHAACVSKNNKHFLLVGHSGAGKTTTSLDLVSKYAFKLGYSDRTIIRVAGNGTLIALGGTSIITYKKSNKDIPREPLSVLAEYVDREVSEINDINRIDLKDETIHGIVFLRTDYQNRDITKIEQFEALVSLYSFFRDSFNSDALIFDGRALYEGETVNPKMKQKTLTELISALQRVPVFGVSGSPQHMSSLINGLADFI